MHAGPQQPLRSRRVYQYSYSSHVRTVLVRTRTSISDDSSVHYLYCIVAGMMAGQAG